jgi:Leucine-rich repeat (LRR) protein
VWAQSALPPGFTKRFTHLRVLDVSGNRLTVLPERLELLARLTSLRADRNHVRPERTSRVTCRALTLRVLNQIVALPKDMPALPQLTELSLEHNRVRATLAIVGDMPGIRCLPRVGVVDIARSHTCRQRWAD